MKVALKTAPLLVAIALVLTSCYPGTQVEVANNTAETLTVVSIDTELKENPYVVPTNQSVRIKVPYRLRVQHSSGIWNYNLPPTPLPKIFRQSIGGNWYLEKYQIENDGSVYVLLPGTNAPTPSIPQQPNGFPLRPLK